MTMKAVRIAAVLAMLAAATLIGVASPAGAEGNGVTQIRGTAVPGLDCTDPGGAGADYALRLPSGDQGDLAGCVYGFQGTPRISQAGTVSVRTMELFIGTLGGDPISFEMAAHITFKDSGPPDFFPYFGRCQHKIVPDDGVSGRINFKDIYEFDADGNFTGNVTFDYFGHISVD